MTIPKINFFMDFTNALQSLMALFVEHISTHSADITSVLKSKITEWIASQAASILHMILHLYRSISLQPHVPYSY